MIMCRTAFALLIATTFLSPGFADEVVALDNDTEGDVESLQVSEQRFVPARFANGLEAAAAEIKFPNFKKDLSLYISCAAKLNTAGEVKDYFCLDYYGGQDAKFRKAAKKFIESTAITPAVVDGKPVPVEFYFRVFFGQQGDQYAVGVFPNWGDDADKYDMEYEAPQRYNQEPLHPACLSDGGMSKVLVGADGKASGDVDLIMSYGVPKHYSVCENWFSQTVLHGQYIPAQHEGKSVPATYVEFGGDISWFTLKTPEGL